jgi:hypothetical protein
MREGMTGQELLQPATLTGRNCLAVTLIWILALVRVVHTVGDRRKGQIKFAGGSEVEKEWFTQLILKKKMSIVRI